MIFLEGYFVYILVYFYREWFFVKISICVEVGELNFVICIPYGPNILIIPFLLKLQRGPKQKETQSVIVSLL